MSTPDTAPSPAGAGAYLFGQSSSDGGLISSAWVPEAGAGAVLLANGTGYPLNQIALDALAVLRGQDPRRLPFFEVAAVLRSLEGVYETYRGMMRATVRRGGDCLRPEMGNRLNDRTVVLVPRDLDPARPRFTAFAAVTSWTRPAASTATTPRSSTSGTRSGGWGASEPGPARTRVPCLGDG